MSAETPSDPQRSPPDDPPRTKGRAPCRQHRPAATADPCILLPDTGLHPPGTVPSGIAYVCNFESGDLRFAKDVCSRSRSFAIRKARAVGREEKNSKRQITSLTRSGMLLGYINPSLAGIASEGQPEARKPVTKPRCPIDQNRGNKNSRAPAAAHVIVSTPDDFPRRAFSLVPTPLFRSAAPGRLPRAPVRRPFPTARFGHEKTRLHRRRAAGIFKIAFRPAA